MKTFRCPKCGEVQKALAKSVGHRCSQNKNAWTEFEEQPA